MKNLEQLKKAKNLLADAILGYCDGNVAQELDEAFAIIVKLIRKEEGEAWWKK